jgi:EAL domain-containing protein (putative c-di-GMP-specific phosphodiesterase class I)
MSSCTTSAASRDVSRRIQAVSGSAASEALSVREHARKGLVRVVELAQRQLRLDVTYIVELTDAAPVYRAVAGDAAAFRVVADCDTPAHSAFCGRLIARQLPSIVADAVADNRLADLAQAHASPIGAFIGVPLRLSDWSPFGVLCGLSRTPRPDLSERDEELMSLLGEVILEDLDEHHSRQRLQSDIVRVIENEDLKVAYQPIFDMQSKQCLGIEALARFAPPFTQPDWTLAASRKFGLSLELERLVIREAWKMLPRLAPGQFLALNVAPDALVELARRANLRDDLPLSQLVVEVTEHSVVDCYGPLLHELAPLRERGLRIAVDDAGAGYASLRHVLELRPDFVKVDRSLIHGIALDHAQQVAVAAFQTLASDLHASVVAEGVERADDLNVAVALGVRAAQGYLLGRPTTNHAILSRWVGERQRAHIQGAAAREGAAREARRRRAVQVA